MTTPIASFSGLASGIQWRDVVDQIMKAEQARSLDPLKAQLTTAGRQREAWTTFRGLLDTLRDASRGLRLGTAFTSFDVAAGASPTTGRSLLTATAGTGAIPGAYQVEVAELARAEKLSGGVVASATAALGVSGDIVLNGATITLDAADSLEAVRNKINAANAGATPSGVTASVLSSGPGAYRLVLSADQAGSAGIAFGDDASGALRGLGFLDTRSRPVSSVTSSIAAALGIAMPTPASVRVGDRTITVDLSTDSLAAIAARIRAAGVDARTVAEPNGDGESYRLVVDGHVQAVDGDAGSADVIAALGLGAGARGDVRHTVATQGFTAGGAPAGAATALTALEIEGVPAGLVAGDAINVRGMRGDGTVVTVGVTVDASDTLQTLLDRINDATSGFGAGTRPASAVLGDDGRIMLTDGTGGESRLALSLSVQKADGTQAAFAGTTVAATGRAREVVNGSDALVRVDGVLVTASSNTVTGAIAGVTLDLQQAEAGTTVTVTVGRNEGAAVDAVKEMVAAYNAITEFVEKQSADGQPLDGSSGLRSVARALRDALRTPGTGVHASAATVGVALSRTGKLEIDEAKLTEAFQANRADLAALFGLEGIGGALDTAANLATRIGDGTVDRQLQALDRSKTALDRRIESVESRLAERQEALIRQFVKMEEALSRMQAQGSYLQSQLAALMPSGQ